MFYNTVVRLVQFLLFLLTGKTDIQNRENLPVDRAFILAAPHRSWIDPLYIAVAAYPHTFATMAKQELFDRNRLLNWLIRKMNGIPVNRDNPGPSAIKQPVTILKEGKMNFLIFSTGTRYDSQVKGGTTTIARLAKAPIIPVVYQGPFTFKELLMRKKGHVYFGTPIELPPGRLTKEEMADFDQELQNSFDNLDHKINPDFSFDYKKK